MTSYLIDINVWLAMTWDLHPLHTFARRWHDSLDNSVLLFCRFTMLGFLRLLTSPGVMGDSAVTVSGALGIYDRWRRDPRVGMAPEPPLAEALFRQALGRFGRLAATKAIGDCYLVGFAQAAGAHLVTFDRGLAQTARRRKAAVTLIAVR